MLCDLNLLVVVWSHSLKDMYNCESDQDCHQLAMCQSTHCECYPFSDEFLGPRCVKTTWANRIRRAVNDNLPALGSPDIGPDTCDQDRKLLGEWYVNKLSTSIYDVVLLHVCHFHHHHHTFWKFIDYRDTRAFILDSCIQEFCKKKVLF